MSYWNRFIHHEVDAIIIGGGFTGLRTALNLRDKHPNWSILVVERMTKGSAASTRNAGFACFGSVGEILDDLKHSDRDQMEELIRHRFDGISELRKIDSIDLVPAGGYEVFTPEDEAVYNDTLSKIPEINELVREATGIRDVFKPASIESFGMNFLPEAIYNEFEFQINPGLLWNVLRDQCAEADVVVRIGSEVESIEAIQGGYRIHLERAEVSCKRLILCTNGLTSTLVPLLNVQPARGQILLTKPIDGVIPTGNFHASAGYYYFRNVGDKILLGGARHLFKEDEQTESTFITSQVLGHLQDYLSNYILPNQKWELEHAWAGTMGMAPGKKPIVSEIDENMFIAAGLGGMGVALSHRIARNLTDLVMQKNPAANG
ncbi:MAG: FAD-binding oxidoreductase [Bacteroidetes bacterium]|nr:FAD-binding oxidoreductase [Bacteroidota bacterium]